MSQPTAAQDARFRAMTGSYAAVARTLLLGDYELLLGRTVDGHIAGLEIIRHDGTPVPAPQILPLLDRARQQALHVAERTAEAALALAQIHGACGLQDESIQDPS
jgi:hypothetical protein